ncbi:hypothetical protein, partial [Aliikangiella coralliicola]|uniref:hypothetical protein n=1 Tax=Aliikangiella coralliicola TaxID=2592383 RepID=UPI00143D959B
KSNIKNIEAIKLAFEQGYNLGSNDFKEGVYINFAETQKLFLDELAKFYEQKNDPDYICT